MSLDRFLTLNLVYPLIRAGMAGKPALPILMYHSISSNPERGVKPYYRLNTSPARFEEQMVWLAEQGFRGVSLREALSAESGLAQSPRPVAITFDDGFRNFYTEAQPILKRFGFKATMYLPTAYIGDARLSFKGTECLVWDEVRELNRQGIEFGSHTHTHPKLYELSRQEVAEELAISKSRIEERLETAADSFCHPYAFPQADAEYTADFKALLARTGFRSSVTTIIGRMTKPGNSQLLPRLPINECDSRAIFAAKLAGAYDWVSLLQSAVKRMKKKANPARMPAPATP